MSKDTGAFKTELSIEEINNLFQEESIHVVYVKSCYICGRDKPELGPLSTCSVCNELYHPKCAFVKGISRSNAYSSNLCGECEMHTHLNWKSSGIDDIDGFEITAFPCLNTKQKFDVPVEVKQERRAAIHISHQFENNKASKFLEYEDSSSEESICAILEESESEESQELEELSDDNESAYEIESGDETGTDVGKLFALFEDSDFSETEPPGHTTSQMSIRKMNTTVKSPRNSKIIERTMLKDIIHSDDKDFSPDDIMEEEEEEEEEEEDETEEDAWKAEVDSQEKRRKRKRRLRKDQQTSHIFRTKSLPDEEPREKTKKKTTQKKWAARIRAIPRKQTIGDDNNFHESKHPERLTLISPVKRKMFPRHQSSNSKSEYGKVELSKLPSSHDQSQTSRPRWMTPNSFSENSRDLAVGRRKRNSMSQMSRNADFRRGTQPFSDQASKRPLRRPSKQPIQRLPQRPPQGSLNLKRPPKRPLKRPVMRLPKQPSVQRHASTAQRSTRYNKDMVDDFSSSSRYSTSKCSEKPDPEDVRQIILESRSLRDLLRKITSRYGRTTAAEIIDNLDDYTNDESKDDTKSEAESLVSIPPPLQNSLNSRSNGNISQIPRSFSNNSALNRGKRVHRMPSSRRTAKIPEALRHTTVQIPRSETSSHSTPTLSRPYLPSSIPRPNARNLNVRIRGHPFAPRPRMIPDQRRPNFESRLVSPGAHLRPPIRPPMLPGVRRRQIDRRFRAPAHMRPMPQSMRPSTKIRQKQVHHLRPPRLPTTFQKPRNFADDDFSNSRYSRY